MGDESGEGGWMWLIDLRISVYKSLPLLLLLSLAGAGGRAAFSGPILERNGMG